MNDSFIFIIIIIPFLFWLVHSVKIMTILLLTKN